MQLPIWEPLRVIQSNFQGLEVEALADHGSVDAASNTWQTSVQGSDAGGRDSPQTVHGPFGDRASSGNFVIPAGWSVRL
jgi:hypothetical protein